MSGARNRLRRRLERHRKRMGKPQRRRTLRVSGPEIKGDLPAQLRPARTAEVAAIIFVARVACEPKRNPPLLHIASTPFPCPGKLGNRRTSRPPREG